MQYRIFKENKLVILNGDNCLTASYENGWLTAESKYFGVFSYTYDTIKPSIAFVKTKQIKNSISFKISDNLSGIKDYNLFPKNCFY